MLTVEDALRMADAGYVLEINDGKIGNFVKERNTDAERRTDQR